MHYGSFLHFNSVLWFLLHFRIRARFMSALYCAVLKLILHPLLRLCRSVQQRWQPLGI